MSHYIWRIENFSMCPQKKGDCIMSPFFRVNGLEKSRWYLCLYPKGHTVADSGYASCFLHRVNEEKEPKDETINFYLNYVVMNAQSFTRLISIYTFVKSKEKDSNHGFSEFMKLSSFPGNRTIDPQNDVLTILCGIQYDTRTLANDLEQTPRLFLARNISLGAIFVSWKERESRDPVCFTIATRIPVERTRVRWIIEDFQTQIKGPLKIPAEIEVAEKSALLLHCYVDSDIDGVSSIMIDIQRRDKHFKQFLLKCRVSVLDEDEHALICLKAEHIFGADYEVWSFPPIIKMRTIENNESVLLPNGTLNLLCEFLISYAGEEYTILDTLQSTYNAANSLVTDIVELSNDEELTDVTLVTEGFELPVHKSVICARSPVFRAMFTHDTQEKRTGVVRMSDMEADTLKNMKRFMYGDDLRDLQLEDTMKLYSAADRYEILRLKDWCASSLKCNLSRSNVCEVLKLSDAHSDVSLSRYVCDFLRLNSSHVLQSDE